MRGHLIYDYRRNHQFPISTWSSWSTYKPESFHDSSVFPRISFCLLLYYYPALYSHPPGFLNVHTVCEYDIELWDFVCTLSCRRKEIIHRFYSDESCVFHYWSHWSQFSRIFIWHFSKRNKYPAMEEPPFAIFCFLPPCGQEMLDLYS